MRKKLLAISVISLALAGCSSNSSSTTSSTKADTVTVAESTTVETTVAEGSLEETSAKATDDTTEAGTSEEKTTVEKTTVETTTEEPAESTDPHESLTYDEYSLVWSDEFDSFDKSSWKCELHNPGYVNAELQEYVQSDDNVYVEDGKLVIRAIKSVDDSGKISYTSGRINTMGKHEFKYGIIEASIKFPEGKGFLPAFWMMPASGKYGAWPKCGEIDIAEVLGDKPTVTYSTIHYGLPHKQNQGKYVLEEGSFTEEYHTYAVEWLPGALNFYVDGQLIYTTNEWYSKNEGSKSIPYPAPFNQKFYIILNLAVGGNWPGNPDDTTDFENAKMYVDYVRVYQKEHYNENVSYPEKEVVLRDPDESGNYVVNGNLSEDEDLTDSKGWNFLQAVEGVGNAEISDGCIKITTEKAGNADYSIQLVSWGIPMKKGNTYRVSFDAYSSEERTMLTGISAPNKNYIRYFGDQKVNLTTEKQTFTYEFSMNEESDADGRLEFNMGKAGSTADIFISNVRIEKI